MRNIMNLITESTANDGWKLIEGPVQDVTGDYCTDIPNHYDAHDLVERYPADPSLGEHSRDVLVYMNERKTTKVVMYPTYDGANGEYYSISVYERV